MKRLFACLLNIFLVQLGFNAHASATASDVRVRTEIQQSKAYAGGYFIVKVIVERKTLNSFFELEQFLPTGMIAEGLESHDAFFKFTSGTVNYSWLRIPQKESFHVMYRVNVPFGALGHYEVKGSYTYIENEERIEKTIPSARIEIVEHKPISDTIAEKKFLGIINNDENAIRNLEAPEKSNVHFKVQLLSSQSKINRDSLKKELNIKDKIYEHQEGGFYKYTVGNYKSYDQARQMKESLGMNKVLPFVVAYNNNVRISVGEAMQKISDQKLLQAYKEQ